MNLQFVLFLNCPRSKYLCPQNILSVLYMTQFLLIYFKEKVRDKNKRKTIIFVIANRRRCAKKKKL